MRFLRGEYLTTNLSNLYLNLVIYIYRGYSRYVYIESGGRLDGWRLDGKGSLASQGTMIGRFF